MLYYLHEMTRLSMAPARAMSEGLQLMLNSPFNPMAGTPAARAMAGAADIFEHLTRSYGKPHWDLATTVVDGHEVAVEEEVVIKRSYCDLLHFKRDIERDDPKLLVAAPLSGHYATLLRGTVEAMLPDHDVYVTDWRDCRMIPVTEDRFNLNDYIDYLIDFLHLLGPNTHVLAVCQPSVPALAAVSVMSGWGDNCVPASADHDRRAGRHPQARRPGSTSWPRSTRWTGSSATSSYSVPPPYPGMFRKVYPGFIQLTNFIAMNYEQHLALLSRAVRAPGGQGDEEASDKKRAFYEEYRAVMDHAGGVLPADDARPCSRTTSCRAAR